MHDDWKALSGDQRKAFTHRLIEHYGRLCYICKLPIAEGDETCEHIKPRSQGGLTTMENCRPAHGTCNSSKGARIALSNIIEHDGLAFFWSE